MTTMHRKQYQFIADVLWEVWLEDQVHLPTLEMVVREFSKQLTRTNARFDESRFIAACTKPRIFPWNY